MMTKKELKHLGKLIMRVHFIPQQRYKLIHALPYLNDARLKSIYTQLQAVYESEQDLLKKAGNIKADADSGKIKIT